MAVTAYQTAFAYVITGTFIVCGNNLIILAIMLRRQLRKRKELLIIASMSIGNLVYGLAYLMIGARRLALHDNPTNVTYTSLECSTKGYIFLFWYGGETMSVMAAVVAIDRFIAVAKPVFYFKLTTSYVYKVTGAVYIGHGFVVLSAGFGASFLNTREYGSYWPAVCLAPFAIPYKLYKFEILVQVTLVTLASFMYFGVLVLLWRRHRKQKSAGGGAAVQAHLAKAQKRQDQITKILGFIIVMSLALFSIPYTLYLLAMVFDVKFPGHENIAFLSWVLAGANAAINVVIYASTHRDIRHSLASLLCGNLSAKVGPTAANPSSFISNLDLKAAKQLNGGEIKGKEQNVAVNHP